MAKNFSIDRRGLRNIMKSDEVGDVCYDVARQVMSNAQALAPDGPTGRYASSFSVSRISERMGGAERAGAQVVNDAPHAAAVEFGNRRVAGQHVLTRALEGL